MPARMGRLSSSMDIQSQNAIYESVNLVVVFTVITDKCAALSGGVDMSKRKVVNS